MRRSAPSAFWVGQLIRVVPECTTNGIMRILLNVRAFERVGNLKWRRCVMRKTDRLGLNLLEPTDQISLEPINENVERLEHAVINAVNKAGDTMTDNLNTVNTAKNELSHTFNPADGGRHSFTCGYNNISLIICFYNCLK